MFFFGGVSVTEKRLQTIPAEKKVMGWGSEDLAKLRKKCRLWQRLGVIGWAKAYGNYGGLRAAVSGKR